MRVPVPVPVEVPPPVSGWSYGLGLMLFADGSWGHTGTIESTHAIVINRPDGLTVALLVSGKYPTGLRRPAGRDRPGRRCQRIALGPPATFTVMAFRTPACRRRRSSLTSTI